MPEPEPAAPETTYARIPRPGVRRDDRTRPRLVLECRERPGRTFTTAEAAELSGYAARGVPCAISRAAAKGQEWTRLKAFHFRKVTTPTPDAAAAKEKLQALVDAVVWAPSDVFDEQPATPTAPDDGKDPHEAQPRRRGNLAPINPNIVGAAAPITHAEVRPRGPARLIKSGGAGGDDE